jgi:uncharacterized protein YqeY
MKSGNELVRDTLRLVKTSIKNKEISKGHFLSDEEVIEVLAKEIAQRKESIASFESGNRAELAAKEKAEIEIIEKYLPEQMDETKLRSLIEQTIAELGANGIVDMGKVMAVLMPKVRGQADGGLVSRLVKEKLS